MPERRHNEFAIKLLATGISIVSLVVGALTINWSGVMQFGHSMIFVYENAGELEHILDDYHEIMYLEKELDSVKTVLFETKNRDSLIHVIQLLNGGKYPYDSIWHKGPSGFRYETTIEKHFNEEHEN